MRRVYKMAPVRDGWSDLGDHLTALPIKWSPYLTVNVEFHTFDDMFPHMAVLQACSPVWAAMRRYQNGPRKKSSRVGASILKHQKT